MNGLDNRVKVLEAKVSGLEIQLVRFTTMLEFHTTVTHYDEKKKVGERKHPCRRGLENVEELFFTDDRRGGG